MSESQPVVYLAQRVHELEAETEYYGHCEISTDAGWKKITGPGWDRAEDAVAWGREHARVVLIRIGSTPQQYYSAGRRLPAGETPPGGLLAWPPAS